MGATAFINIGHGADPAVAFQAVAEQARYEHGHGGYTGTIAEKGSFRPVPTVKAPVTLSEARGIAEGLLNDWDSEFQDKWGPAGAIPLSTLGEDATSVRTVAVTVNGPDKYPATEQVDALVKLRETAETIERIVDRRIGLGVPVTRKATAVTGPTTTIYRVVPVTTPNAPVGTRATDCSFATSAEARAEARQLAAANPGHLFEVRGQLERAGGPALAREGVEVVGWKVPVEVRIGRFEKAPAAVKVPVGWMFFGVASS